MATNPAVSLPRAAAVRAALRKLDLFVVSENVLSNDTINAGAHVLLPAAAWGEKDGTITNSERCISRQRAFLPLPGRCQAGLVDHLLRLRGVWALPTRSIIDSAAEVFREHAALRHSRTAGRAASISAAYPDFGRSITTRSTPVQWPLRKGEKPVERRFFAAGGFFTPDRQGEVRDARAAGIARRDLGRVPIAAEHRAHPRPVAHHDADRSKSAACIRICRSPSSRCIRTMLASTASTMAGLHGFDRARCLHSESDHQRKPTPWLAVRADPLEC